MNSAAVACPLGKGMHIFLGFIPISCSAVCELAQCFPAISTGANIDPIEAQQLFRLPSISVLVARRKPTLFYTKRKHLINSHCLKSVYKLNAFYVKCSFVWDSRYGRQIALESWTRFQYVQWRYIWLLVIEGLIVGFVQQREGYFVPPLQSPSASPGNVSFLRTPQTRLLILKWRFFFAVLPPSMELMMQFFAWAEKFLYNCSSLRVKSGRCDKSFWLKRHTCCDRSSRLKSN